MIYLLIAATTTGTSTAGHSSGGSLTLFIIVLALAALWLIVIRPQRRKQKLQQSMQSELAIGDEILTAGGVYGKVTRIDENEVGVEIAPNVEVRLARRAIAVHLTEPAAADGDTEPDTADPDTADPDTADPDTAGDAPDSGEETPG